MIDPIFCVAFVYWAHIEMANAHTHFGKKTDVRKKDMHKHRVLTNTKSVYTHSEKLLLLAHSVALYPNPQKIWKRSRKKKSQYDFNRNLFLFVVRPINRMLGAVSIYRLPLFHYEFVWNEIQCYKRHSGRPISCLVNQ